MERLTRAITERFLAVWHRFQPLRFHNFARDAVIADRPAEMIDVRDLMRRHSPAGHAARADAYFIREDEFASLSRRPFELTAETQPRLYGLSTLLQGLALFRGAELLDFGTGTGWLSRCFAYMGCRVTGIDVSEQALVLARRFLDRDALRAELDIDFRSYDGTILPLPDASRDRIVCFDAFHHVLDQATMIGEFARVLRPGGIAAFHEPGPEHSRTPQAQFEMAHFDVIENDIDVWHIWKLAQQSGFKDIRIALPQQISPLIDIYTFQRIADGRPNGSDMRYIVQNIVNLGYNSRIFFLYK
jgi:SAM-dependent methyltransferase